MGRDVAQMRGEPCVCSREGRGAEAKTGVSFNGTSGEVPQRPLTDYTACPDGGNKAVPSPKPKTMPERWGAGEPQPVI